MTILRQGTLEEMVTGRRRLNLYGCLHLHSAAFKGFHHSNELGERPRVHLAHRAAAMDLDRDLTQAELGRDLLV